MTKQVSITTSNGYTVKLYWNIIRQYVLRELQEPINWFNFNNGNIYYDAACNMYMTLVDHDNKTITLVETK